jgi:ubiquinone/menaquinone biosynthesis C-methylase UbiE
VNAEKPDRNSTDAKIGFFDHLAREGDALCFQPGDEAKLARLQERLGDLRGLRVLEPGCGAGPLTAWLARWVAPGGSVDAFDPSGEMLARCRQAIAGCEQVRLTQTSCENAVFPNETFDCVVCFRVLNVTRLDVKRRASPKSASRASSSSSTSPKAPSASR